MPQSWIGKTIGGRYKIEALLGQGGMSAVYKATDPNLRRIVAIKLIHAHLSTDPNFIGRFKEEAAAVARLRHPNIVQVHDFNVDGDTYYMVMEFLAGETLQKRLRRLSSAGRYMPLNEAVSLCIQLCEAAGYAHDHELVHRDIKPANIIINVNGQAILMDFGIVKILGGDYHTATGATIGTAMYMPPEQIRSERIDERADIYSLGVTLYEMLSGQPPYMADSALTLMMMVLNDPLPDLRQTRQGISDRLWNVVKKALSKEPSERFQRMSEMAAALREVQAELVDSPSAPAVTEVEIRDVESSRPADISQDQTEPETVEDPRDIQPEDVYQATHQHAGVESPSSQTTQQVLQIEEAPVLSPTAKSKTGFISGLGKRRVILGVAGILIVALVVTLAFVILNARRLPELQLNSISLPTDTLTAQTAPFVVNLGNWDLGSSIRALVFSPDDSLLGTANDRNVSPFSQYHYYSALWKVQSSELQRYLLGHDNWVVDVAFSTSGQIFGSASDDKNVMLWQVSDGRLIRKIETSFGEVTCLDFSPNDLLLATGSWYGAVSLFDVSNGNLLRTLQNSDYGIVDVDFSPDGTLLATASQDNNVLLWQVSDGSLVNVLEGHTAPVSRAVFSPDGSLLASASDDYTVKIWQVSDGSLLHSLAGHTDVINAIAFSTDGSLLASGSDDGTLRLWRVSDGTLLGIPTADSDMIYDVAFSPDGYLLASGAADGIIQFWGISEAIPLEEK